MRSKQTLAYEIADAPANWRIRRVCLYHGDFFSWKKSCANCRYFITFSEVVQDEER